MNDCVVEWKFGGLGAAVGAIVEETEVLIADSNIALLEGLLEHSTTRIPTGSFHKTVHVLPTVPTQVIEAELIKLKENQ